MRDSAGDRLDEATFISTEGDPDESIAIRRRRAASDRPTMQSTMVIEHLGADDQQVRAGRGIICDRDFPDRSVIRPPSTFRLEIAASNWNIVRRITFKRFRKIAGAQCD